MLAGLPLPVALESAAGTVMLRRASADDLDALVGLLSDDPLGARKGDTGDPEDRRAYLEALLQIIGDPSNELLVALDPSGIPVATMQLTRIPGMARRGTARLLLEAVLVRSDRRSNGIGTAMIRWATGTAAVLLGAGLVELTSDAARQDAHRFYERLGFAGSHLGFKYRVE
jgi:GNAT superfamily N-acetyltransferase